MARAVLAHQAGPVDRDQDRQIVLADVVDLLVEGPLEERGVERHDGPLTGQGHTRSHGDGVLLGDADVEEAVRELALRIRRGRFRWAYRR